MDPQDVKVLKIFDEVTAGTSDQDSAEVDMQGFEWVKFIILFGTSAADNGIKAIQQDTVTGMATAADLVGTKKLLDATETVAVVDVVKPRERFLQAVVERGTSTTIAAGFAILGGARTVPYDQDADTDTAHEHHVSPAEGTA